MKFQKPNFFIIGAQKSGTTSLAYYLSQHPNVCMSVPKEPRYFCSDYGDRFRIAKTERQYERCFQHRRPEHLAIGDASPVYLNSRDAVRKIIDYNPEARFIILLRNPIEMAAALHSESLACGDESVASFKTAWHMQDLRTAESEQSGDPYLKGLVYGEVAAVGRQVQRVYQQVSRDRVCIVWFDRFAEDTEGSVKEVLQFLDLSTDVELDYTIKNENRQVKSRMVASAFSAVSQVVRKAGFMGGTGLGTALLHSRLMSRKQKREPLSPQLRSELAAYFTTDIEILEQLTGKDLSHWKSPATECAGVMPGTT
ncbi:MAG: sulfotransferase [Nitrospirota bacterium]|nr:sulfotransferase [Nitrospirota bacterium]